MNNINNQNEINVGIDKDKTHMSSSEPEGNILVIALCYLSFSLVVCAYSKT